MKSLNEIYFLYRVESDKGRYHNYIERVYEKLLAPYRDKPIYLLEIGVWRGGSMKMWADYFYNGEIHGVDIRKPIEIKHDRIKIHQINATTEAVCDLGFEWDIIIDDGSHILEEQIGAYELLWPKLKKGGVYVIEDCWTKDKKIWIEKFGEENWNHGNDDKKTDNIIVLRK